MQVNNLQISFAIFNDCRFHKYYFKFDNLIKKCTGEVCTPPPLDYDIGAFAPYTTVVWVSLQSSMFSTILFTRW